jgi:hypothetical protein
MSLYGNAVGRVDAKVHVIRFGDLAKDGSVTSADRGLW